MKSPIMEEERGWRVEVAVPNQAGLKGGPSFRKPYYICEFGDYWGPNDIADNIDNIEQELTAMGFTNQEWI